GSPVDANSLVLSTSVYHAMLGHLPEFDRGVKRARFAVLRLTNIPAILVEGGFVTEREESRLIAKSEWRTKLAQAISVGIENYRGLVETKQRPMLLADYRRQFEGVLVARDATAPAPNANGSVMPASNQLAPTAQLTSPVRREPSPQLAVSDNLVAEAAPASSAPPPEVAAVIEREDGTQTPEAIGAQAEQTLAATGEAEVTMPDGGEQAADGHLSPEVPQALPAGRVRNYWILRFAPPPKFRE
ncbi:MAG: N-acetylmuramoyl-L-alanine amidase, partial [Chthoniobacterales bacterium]|nr:N-acetylmuramoyl-L-alanine amidase [Chthoniobacterales bacterium]